MQNNLKQQDFLKLFSVKGTPIYFHWTVIALLILISGVYLYKLEFPFIVFALLIIVVVHELGHKWFAAISQLKSTRIDIYPIGGVCYHEEAETEYENAFIAWGGVVAQAIIFIPALILYYAIGDSLPLYLKSFLYYLGFTNLFIALFNLLPFSVLDGGKCWRLIPLYIKYGKINAKSKKPKKTNSIHQERFDQYLKNKKK